MGREWYKAGRSSKRNVGSRGDHREASTASSSGCMSVVLQFFDFHPQTTVRPASLSAQHHNITVHKGVEAPRNSFESRGGTGKSSSITNTENSLKSIRFPIQSGVQIKTSLPTMSKAGILDDDISSPAAKTPTLVARLMGLELLPDAHSPRSSSSVFTPNSQTKHTLHHTRQNVLTKPRTSKDGTDITSSRSLPVTPRISARKSDVEHRLSLQIIRENVSLNEKEMQLSRISYSRLNLEDKTNRSPSHYAKQIGKQVKESVSRKVGLDITNTVRKREQRRDELLISQVKSKKKGTNKFLDENCSTEKHSPASCSPRLRFIDTKNKVKTSPSATRDQISEPQPRGILRLPKFQALHEKQRQCQKGVQASQCKKAASDKMSPRLSDIIRNKHAELFIRPMSNPRSNIAEIKNKCKKTKPLLPSNLLNLPTPLPVKKDPSPPATKIPLKQVPDTKESNEKISELFSRSIHKYKQETRHRAFNPRDREDNDKDRLNGVSVTGAVGRAEFRYICQILYCTGIQRGKKVSFTGWFSPSHPPLDPSIFHRLEECSTSDIVTRKHHGVIPSKSSLGLRCNRKLLFDVVGEILVELLNPYVKIEPWMINWSTRPTHSYHNYECSCRDQNQMEGSKLIEMVYTKIQSFPMSDCQFLEDIDMLIEEDLRKIEFQEEVMMTFEQAEGLVSEIEGDIFGTLVLEAVMGYISTLSLTKETVSVGLKCQDEGRFGSGLDGVPSN